MPVMLLLVIWMLQVFDLHALPDYELVIPQKIHEVHRRGTQDKYPHVVQYKLHIEGKPVVLHLERNENLISGNYTETEYQQDNTPITRSPEEDMQDHCHYQGSVTSDNGSMASISLCDGIRGIILMGGSKLLIEPQNLTSGEHALFRKLEETPSAGCGVRHVPLEAANLEEIAFYNRRGGQRPQASDLMRLPKYIEIYLVADYLIYLKYNRNLKAVRARITEILNYANLEYKPLDVYLILTGIEIWNTKDQILVDTASENVLKRFARWRWETLSARVPNDHAQLITGINFDGPTVGLTYLGAMCLRTSAAVIQDLNKRAAFTGAIMAHETGHSLGMDHDTKGCQCSSRSCIMEATISNILPSKFSKCSINQHKKFLQTALPSCILNKPPKGNDRSTAMCGNKLVELGEECDCGTSKECSDPCCNPSNCKLKRGAVCASEEECCENCQIKKAGAVCRPSENDCDLPDVCDGKSSVCPANRFKPDGVSCMNGKGYCLRGRCPNSQEHCMFLWGKDAVVAGDDCFDVNTVGEIHGHCKQSGNNYIPCSPQDVKCGVLYCSGGEKYPSVMADIAVNPTCKVVLHPVGMVQPGATCGPEKVCHQRQCVDVKRLYGSNGSTGSNSCSKKCPNNKICEQSGQCYCQEGGYLKKCD
ncbi:zinc metalloproteinase-disintegrin-like protein H3 [Hyperolius riggenbachi]|uniref:zinc metalloproteinase-disintegrin-like protein H3 n=1 Tax=Hyperolius riggenbachi TaxID=752182 RepID=UPI0035A30E9D